MEFTKKMVLVDPRVLESIKSPNEPVPNAQIESVRDLDHQMRAVLSRNDLDIEDKANLYHQSLQRYLTRVNQYKESPVAKVEMVTKSTSNSKDNSEDSPNPVEDDIISSVPPSMQKKAGRLLSRLKSNPEIKWNDKGEIEYKGKTVKQSNMTDLINDILRNRKNVADPIGWDMFSTVLGDMNIPQDLVGNTKRWQFMRKRPLKDTESFVTPQSTLRLKHTTKEAATPTTAIKKRKAVAPKDLSPKWASYK